ncbi:MAG: hypothetical protein UHN02_01875 [Acutalibacteraceae bacterium]|nr:hypothetical protein [Acutalibacteraceae bacterium]
MKMRTKAIITVAIILLFVVATVAVIIIFGSYDDKKNTTMTSGLSSWTIESSTKSPDPDTSADSQSEEEVVMTAEEQFITAWNNLIDELNYKKFRIDKYEVVKNRVVLVGLNSSSTNVVLDFTIDGELVMSIMGSKDRNEIANLTQVFYAMMTEDTVNDTLSILVREQDEVSITISGCEFNATVTTQKDSSFSATMKLIKPITE